MRRVVYAGVQRAADSLWRFARAVDRRFPERTFQPKWAPAPLLKQREKTFPPLGFPRKTDSLCPRCVSEVRVPDPLRRSRLEGPDRGQARRDPGRDRRGERPDPDEEGLPEARALRGRDVHGSRLLQAARVDVPRPRLRDSEGRPPRARHVLHQVRPRGRADDRPDQPLQHDVRPVLHGRQPGRLRPRARVGRGPEAARRRRLDQAAPPAVGPVLGRRADALAALPPGDPPRPQARVLLGPVRDQRHPLRAGRVLREGGGRGRACASPTCSSTASATRTTSTARSATSTTSSCARSRT